MSYSMEDNEYGTIRLRIISMIIKQCKMFMKGFHIHH